MATFLFGRYERDLVNVVIYICRGVYTHSFSSGGNQRTIRSATKFFFPPFTSTRLCAEPCVVYVTLRRHGESQVARSRAGRFSVGPQMQIVIKAKLMKSMCEGAHRRRTSILCHKAYGLVCLAPSLCRVKGSFELPVSNPPTIYIFTSSFFMNFGGSLGEISLAQTHKLGRKHPSSRCLHYPNGCGQSTRPYRILLGRTQPDLSMREPNVKHS